MTTDDRIREAERKLDGWLTKLVIATNRIRYYRTRLRALQRRRQADGRLRPQPSRSIRVR